MATMESKIAHFQKTVRETLYNSVNRSDWDELEIAAEELYKLRYDHRSDTATSNLLSDVLKMFHSAHKECLQRLWEAELMQKKGNEHLHQKNYQEAATYYTRSLIWNPKDSKVYSNRALCHMRLEKMPQVLEDAEKCIELDPKFSGGYFRKGSVQLLMNDYKMAFDTFQEGLKHNPTDKCLVGGVERNFMKLVVGIVLERIKLLKEPFYPSSSFENVTRQECPDHNLRKGKAGEGTIVFQQEKGKCCSFNEHVIYNMPTVNPNMPTVNPALPTVKLTSPGQHVFGMKLSKVIIAAEVASIFADFMELPVLGMMCSVVAVLGNLESAKRDHYKPFPMLKLLFAAVQLITCMLMCLSELMDKEIQWLEAFGKEARSYHLCMLFISLALHH